MQSQVVLRFDFGRHCDLCSRASLMIAKAFMTAERFEALLVPLVDSVRCTQAKPACLPAGPLPVVPLDAVDSVSCSAFLSAKAVDTVSVSDR